MPRSFTAARSTTIALSPARTVAPCLASESPGRLSQHITSLEEVWQAQAGQNLRVGAELVFAICRAKNVEVVIINHGEDTGFEQELPGDVLETIAMFSAKLHGSRSHKNQKLIAGVRSALKEAPCS